MASADLGPERPKTMSGSQNSMRAEHLGGQILALILALAEERGDSLAAIPTLVLCPKIALAGCCF